MRILEDANDEQQQQEDYYNDDVTYINGGADEKWCKIYDKNDFFTVLVQIFLALFALGSLWIKRMQEVPRRTFWTWFMDVFKQGLGACYAHVLNMIVAAVLAENMRGETELKDQCAWYGMSYLIDTTLGLFLAIICLRILDYFAKERDWTHLKHSGVYVGVDGWKHWISQVAAWMFILSIVKLIIYWIMWAFSEGLAFLGQALFAPLQGNIRLELLFVMILFPGILNIIYFWIADHHLKADATHEGAHEIDETAITPDTRSDALLNDEQGTFQPPAAYNATVV